MVELLFTVSNVLLIIIELFIVGVVSNIYFRVKTNEKRVKTLENKIEECQKKTE